MNIHLQPRDITLLWILMCILCFIMGTYIGEWATIRKVTKLWNDTVDAYNKMQSTR